MTDRTIEELANEVANEVGRCFQGFKLEKIEDVDNVLTITFSFSDPYHVEVTINLHDHDTDESVKAEIRRQLQTA